MGFVTVTQETCIVVRSYPVSTFVVVSAIIGIFTCRLGAILKFGWDQNQYLVFGLWINIGSVRIRLCDSKNPPKCDAMDITDLLSQII